MKLENRVALITGAGSGIGAATAERFTREGAAVVVMDLDGDRAAAVASNLADAGARVRPFVGNVSSAEDASGAVTVAVDAFGGLDILVNNAGIGLPGSVVSMSEADWDRVWTVNVKSGFLMSKYSVPAIRERGGGSILFTASMGAVASSTGLLAYCATKAAIVSMVKTMALDHGPHGIRVNCICPGPTRTPGFEQQIQAAGISEESFVEGIPVGRIADPEDMAAAFTWLASEDAAFVNGQALLLDGGQYGGMFLRHLVEP